MNDLFIQELEVKPKYMTYNMRTQFNSNNNFSDSEKNFNPSDSRTSFFIYDKQIKSEKELTMATP